MHKNGQEIQFSEIPQKLLSCHKNPGTDLQQCYDRISEGRGKKKAEIDREKQRER